MPVRVFFAGKGEVDCQEFELPRVDDNDVLVRTHFSLISTGTETTIYHRLFEDGSHWDPWVKYPFYPGYAAVGEVLEAGANVSNVSVGDYVALRGNHASHIVFPSELCVRIPNGFDLRAAAWFASAKIAAMAARKAQFTLGDSVVVVGAGPIGQMAVRWARAAGAEIIAVVDPVDMRLEMARRGGATACFCKPVEDCFDEIRKVNYGKLCRAVVDATGNPEVFSASLHCARPFGTVAILGDTGMPTEQHLTSDVMMKGLTIVGAHDSHETSEWNGGTITRLFFNLAMTGRFDLQGLNTHFFPPEECRDAFDLASVRRHETMGIVFDWTESQ